MFLLEFSMLNVQYSALYKINTDQIITIIIIIKDQRNQYIHIFFDIRTLLCPQSLDKCTKRKTM